MEGSASEAMPDGGPTGTRTRIRTRTTDQATDPPHQVADRRATDMEFAQQLATPLQATGPTGASDNYCMRSIGNDVIYTNIYICLKIHYYPVISLFLFSLWLKQDQCLLYHTT